MVTGLSQQLKGEEGQREGNPPGVRCHTEAALAIGAPRLEEFERAIRESSRTLLVLSPAYLAEGFA